MSRPVESQQPTIAFGGHAKATSSVSTDQPASRTTGNTQRQEVRLHQVSSPHGTVSYFAPAE